MPFQKNQASQTIFATLVNATTGAAITSGATVFVAGDSSSQSSGAGTLTHIGNGQWSYVPTQAETNVNMFGYSFAGTNVVPVGGTIPTVDYPRAAIPAAASGAAGGLIPFGATLPIAPAANTIDAALSWAANQVGRNGTAQAGGANTITLDSGASAIDGAYNGHWIKLTGGTGAGQWATGVSYVGSTKVLTISRPIAGGGWNSGQTPDSTTTFEIGLVPQASLLPGQNFNNTGQSALYPDSAGVTSILAAINDSQSGFTVVSCSGSPSVLTVSGLTVAAGNLGGMAVDVLTVTTGALKARAIIGSAAGNSSSMALTLTSTLTGVNASDTGNVF